MGKNEVSNLKETLLKSGFIEDNIWLNEYIALITLNLNNEIIKGETQRHHIIPKFYYTLKQLPINNLTENLVNLSYRDHVLAHYYLARCGKGEFKKRNCLAFINMTNYKQKVTKENKELFISLDAYKELLEIKKSFMVSYSLGRKWTEEQRKRRSIAYTGPGNNRYGTHHTEETKRKIGAVHKGKYVSPETRQKIGEKKQKDSIGRIWITNGIINKFIKREEYNDKYKYNSNWELGHIQKGSDKHKVGKPQ